MIYYSYWEGCSQIRPLCHTCYKMESLQIFHTWPERTKQVTGQKLSAILSIMERAVEHITEGEQEWLTLLPELVDENASCLLTQRRAHLWALVLEARSVPCRVEPGPQGWHLQVPAEHIEQAICELRLFETENRNWPPSAPPVHPLAENTLISLSVFILMATFHNFTRLDSALFGHYSVDWISIGNAQAAKIMDGQWWRLITALTLHADDVHLYSNLAIGGIFIIFLCHELGSGLAWGLILGSGVLGNLANAAVQSPGHSSVGASTAVFGTVGILAALSLVRHRHYLQRRWLLPVAAALALLALLGTEGKNTDLGAHLFGFVSGVALGLVAEHPLGKHGRPGMVLNALLALSCIIVVVLAWWVAVAQR